MEFAADVRPTCGFNDTAGFVQPIESRKGIGLQRAAERGQMSGRMFRLAIGRVGKPNRRRVRASRRPIVTHIGPQTTGLCFAVSWSQHRNRYVIGVEFRRIEHVLTDRIDQGLQYPARTADPTRQRRAIQFHACTGVDPGLPIQRQMIRILSHDHVRQQTGPSQSVVNRAIRSRFLHDRVTLCTSQLRPHCTSHFETPWHELQRFRNIVAQGTERATAVGTCTVFGLKRFGFARQIGRQRAACRLRARRRATTG